MKTLAEMITELISSHKRKDRLCKITGKPSTAKETAAWTKKSKLKLPQDYEQFLLEVGPFDLHIGKYGSALRFLPLSAVGPVGPLVGRESVPEFWYAIADIFDGNYVLMDLSSVKNDKVDILDGFHEVIPYEATIIAKSFTEFLYRAIKDPDFSPGGGGGREFWAKFECYGDKGLH